MNEIINQIIWRRSKREDKFTELGSVKEQTIRFFCSLLSEVDVITDFLYWNDVKAIKTNFKGKIQTINAVLAFAIIGSILEFHKITKTIEYINDNDNEREKIKSKNEKNIEIPLLINVLEDFPQLILLLYISKNTEFSNYAVFSFWIGVFSFVASLLIVAVEIGKENGKHTQRESIFQNLWIRAQYHFNPDSVRDSIDIKVDREAYAVILGAIPCHLILIILFFVFYFD